MQRSRYPPWNNSFMITAIGFHARGIYWEYLIRSAKRLGIQIDISITITIAVTITVIAVFIGINAIGDHADDFDSNRREALGCANHRAAAILCWIDNQYQAINKSAYHLRVASSKNGRAVD